MSSSLKAALIGCGGIAQAHLQGYLDNDIIITALTDTSPQAMQATAEKLPHAQCYDSFQDLIDQAQVDIVSVCTPPVAHAQAVTAALQKGIHVLCEKPLAHNLTDAQAIRQAAASSSALLMLAYRHRFLPAITTMKSIIDQGTIGKPVFFHNTFCGPAFDMQNRWFTQKDIAGGGCMLDTASHSVDLFRFIIGQVVEQQAVMTQHFANTDVEDAAILNLKADNGCLASLSSSFVAGDGMAFIDITGQDGRIRYDYMQPEQLMLKQRDKEKWQTIPVQPSNGFCEQIAALKDAILNHKPAPITIDDGFRALEIILATYSA